MTTETFYLPLGKYNHTETYTSYTSHIHSKAAVWVHKEEEGIHQRMVHHI